MDWQSCTDERAKYQLYLASREWACRKRLVKNRSKEICERCKSNPSSQVHHLTYARKYRELPEDLQDLCSGCHEFIHAQSEQDPIDLIPPQLMGRTVQSLYLAGKITGTNWRDEFFESEGKWSSENHGLLSERLNTPGQEEWGAVRGAVKNPAGKLIDYVGPWWKDVDLDSGGHGCANYSATGKHLFASSYTHDSATTKSADLFNQIKLSLVGFPDLLLFAWIDSLDCYGTLIEIGMCGGFHNRKPIVVIAMPPDFDPNRDFWMAEQIADYRVRAGSAIEAWGKLWSGECEQRPSEVTVPTDEAWRQRDAIGLDGGASC